MLPWLVRALALALVAAPGCLSAKDACTRNADCPDGSCVNGRCVAADTVADAPDTADTVTPVDTVAPVDTAPPPCTLPGAVRPCEGDCQDLAFPLERCVDGAWSACACASSAPYHIATKGAIKHAGLAGTPNGALYACYRIDGDLALAYQFAPTPPDNWDVQLVGAASDACDLATGFGETVHMVYAVGEGDDTPRDLAYAPILNNVIGAPASPGTAGDGDDGRQPKVAVAKNGAVHALAGGRLAGGQDVLRHFEQTGLDTWSDDLVASLPTASDDQALALCDDGTQLALYAKGVGSPHWTARIAARGDGTWQTALLDDSAQLVGIGAALVCDGGAAHGLFLDFYDYALREAWSATPGTLASWETAAVPTADRQILYFNDLVVAGEHLWAAVSADDGDILLGARRRDRSTAWRFHRVAAAEGGLTGDVRLWLDALGHPHVLYFGAQDGGPWILTLVDP